MLLPAPSSSPWWALGVVSVLTAVLLLLVFRFISHQERIAIAKNRIKAHLLEIRLFRDDPQLVLRAQKDILLALLKYLKLAAVPLAVLILPLVYLALHLELFFGYEPLHPGAAAVVAVTVDDKTPLDRVVANLSVSDGLKIETPPLRLPHAHEIDWRVRAVREGNHEIILTLGDTALAKTVTVGTTLRRVTPIREQDSWPTTLVAPGEAALPRDAGVKAIAVQYPPRTFEFFGWQMHWLVPFMGIALLAGFALQGLLGVRI